jgi:hypothetical protein
VKEGRLGLGERKKVSAPLMNVVRTLEGGNSGEVKGEWELGRERGDLVGKGDN